MPLRASRCPQGHSIGSFTHWYYIIDHALAGIESHKDFGVHLYRYTNERQSICLLRPKRPFGSFFLITFQAKCLQVGCRLGCSQCGHGSQSITLCPLHAHPSGAILASRLGQHVHPGMTIDKGDSSLNCLNSSHHRTFNLRLKPYI